MGRNKNLETLIKENNCILLDYPCKKHNSEVINPYCKEYYETIKITEEDVFKVDETGKEDLYGLRKSILYKIADLSGLKWDLKSEIIKNEPNSIVYKAVASIRNYIGTMETFFTIKEFNIPLEEEGILKKYLKVGETILQTGTEEEKEIFKDISVEDWARSTARNEIYKIKKNKVSLAETYAKIKLIRQMFNIAFLKKEDLVKPIVIRRIDIAVDLNEKLIQEHYLKLALNSSLIANTGSSFSLFESEKTETEEKKS